MSKKRCVAGAGRLENYFDSMSGSSSVSSSIENKKSELSDSLRQQRKFLLRWKLLFPWVEFEDGSHENETLYCREYCSAKLKNAFAVGKDRPPGGTSLPTSTTTAELPRNTPFLTATGI